MSELVVSGLVKRRAALAGDIEAAHEGLRKMVADLENLDATIVQFDPSFKVETIKPNGFRPPSDWSQPGPDGPDHPQHPTASLRAAYQPRHCPTATGRAGAG